MSKSSVVTTWYLNPQKLHTSFTCVADISGPATFFRVLWLRLPDAAQRSGGGPGVWPLQQGFCRQKAS